MAEHFEAKKHAYRQTQDGIVISFVCHPSDLATALALAPLGTRYMVAVAEIGDNEKPIEKPDNSQLQAALSKPHRQWAELSLAAQAGIRCADPEYQAFLNTDEEGAVYYVREYCGVKSRSEIRFGSNAGKDWVLLEAKFQQYLTDRRYASVAR